MTAARPPRARNRGRRAATGHARGAPLPLRAAGERGDRRSASKSPSVALHRRLYPGSSDGVSGRPCGPDAGDRAASRATGTARIDDGGYSGGSRGLDPDRPLGRGRGPRRRVRTGDVTTFPVKQGGLATQQAETAAEALAAVPARSLAPRSFGAGTPRAAPHGDPSVPPQPTSAAARARREADWSRAVVAAEQDRRPAPPPRTCTGRPGRREARASPRAPGSIEVPDHVAESVGALKGTATLRVRQRRRRLAGTPPASGGLSCEADADSAAHSAR